MPMPIPMPSLILWASRALNALYDGYVVILSLGLGFPYNIEYQHHHVTITHE